MSTPPSKFFNRYEFDEDVRDERDRLRAVNGQLLAALKALLDLVAYLKVGIYTFDDCLKIESEARAAIAEAQKATGGQ